jgi:PPOX class probable F420-dependent enzyme
LDSQPTPQCQSTLPLANTEEELMRPMTPAEARVFLLERPRTAKLATVRADGRPHVAPVWFDLDDQGRLVFTTAQDSVKGKSLRRDLRVCLCVDDDTPPFAYVMIEGAASLSDDLDDLLHWATRIGGRYMGWRQAEAYGKRNGVAGELLVRVEPTHIVAKSNITDW